MADCDSKQCTKCGETKPRTEYHKRQSSADGLRHQCKACRIKNSTEWIHNNRERYNSRIRRDRAANPEKYKAWADAYKNADTARHAAIKRAWLEANQDKRKATIRKYHQSRKAEDCAKVRERQARKVNATPAWADADLMADLYRLARVWMDATGDEYHVDHEVPLQSPLVCGLHCPANLAVVPAALNRRKSNRYWPDMP